MVETTHQVDLTTCDMEPIHIIGRIQSFGWLISLSSDWIINHASLNCGKLFGKEAVDLIGTPVRDLLSPSALHDIRARMQLMTSEDAVERVFGVALMEDEREFDVAVHRSGRSYVLEFEPSETDRRRDYVGFVRPMIDRMRKSGSVESLCRTAARNIRGLTGFDRVMIYRFGADGAGEVIAESLSGNTDSYMGTHFPASDIPAQARRLYSRNLLRIISDVSDPTVPIIPATGPDGDPLDLSMSTLRAVSPIHIEYLRNMGVGASMSISIMQRGRLWGLIACHHYAPLCLSYSVRTAAELFGEFFAYLLDQAEVEASQRMRKTSTRLHDEIMSRVAGGGGLLASFEEFAGSIASVIPYDGIVGWVDGEFVARGSTPGREEFASLARFLNTAGASTVWSTNTIAAVYPAASGFADVAAGLLALPVSRSPRDYIVLFRKEFVHEVNWAGNPNKPVEVGPLGARLTPRKSFEIWKEERRGQSRKWEDDEVASAEGLRVTLLEVVLRMTDAANAERAMASQRQDVLIAELNHRVRNILNLIRSLVVQSREGSETIDQFAEIVGNRIYALARAHDQVTRANWTPSSLHLLIETECEAYVGAQGAGRVRIEGPDAMIAPGAFTTLALIFHELTTNSCKYGSLSNSEGVVTVRIERHADMSLEIDWLESGGPPVARPERRGFGSTIIERTIPHELGGSALVDYLPGGLQARFVVPAEHIAAHMTPVPSAPREPARAAPANEVHASVSGGLALIVEDNVIIAMEAEDMLAELGFDNCRIVGSVGEAQRAIEHEDVTFAMLDINLGSQSSEPVARLLAERGVPFIFASGYGERPFENGEFAGVPIVTKPYSRRDVLAAITGLSADT